jgi:hypothetical protein
MNVEIGAEAAQFPEKEYINGIVVADRYPIVRKFLEFTNPILVIFPIVR